MSFSEETKQIMKHYLELYLKGTIIREEQDVLDAYVEEIKNSTNPEDITFVSAYQGKVNKTREETLTKEAEMKENGEVRVLKLNNHHNKCSYNCRSRSCNNYLVHEKLNRG